MLKILPVFKLLGESTAKLAEVGGKGLSLIKSSESGLPVPPGFILSVEFFAHGWTGSRPLLFLHSTKSSEKLLSMLQRGALVARE